MKMLLVPGAVTVLHEMMTLTELRAKLKSFLFFFYIERFDPSFYNQLYMTLVFSVCVVSKTCFLCSDE